mmetsp:Transcript_16684/g.51959  ORF Transcript_16684/g.51959 Transcript_16684/m.51959 type:complete len:220 (+) Transcript_16684:1467-2126(+)
MATSASASTPESGNKPGNAPVLMPILMAPMVTAAAMTPRHSKTTAHWTCLKNARTPSAARAASFDGAHAPGARPPAKHVATSKSSGSRARTGGPFGALGPPIARTSRSGAQPRARASISASQWKSAPSRVAAAASTPMSHMPARNKPVPATTTATGGSHVGSALAARRARRIANARPSARPSQSDPSAAETRKPGAAATRAPDLQRLTPMDASIPAVTG